jgi:KUP system potassium uptake protein
MADQGEMTRVGQKAPVKERPVTAAAALAAMGIVYGDLGTSPLYTYQTIVDSVGGHPSATAALGLLSLVVWTLIITVSIKYCVFVMRADNHGEGGILALMSLVTGKLRGRTAAALVACGLFGAALIYGDGIITPAISVLSALEGIDVVTKAFAPYEVPLALVILLLLFVAQSRGTATIGKLFGPVMARRSMPTWAISGGGRSASPGIRSSCRRCC